MRTQHLATELMQRYLRARRQRYFHGQHDGEYFFILTVDGKRLHVHLEMPRGHRDMVAIRVTPTYFFPATDRGRLTRFANAWNRGNPRAKAKVHPSSDPNQIGVVAQNSYPVGDGVDFGDFAGFVDDTIRSAISLFGEIAPAGQTPSRRVVATWLPDAG